ncbi:MAG: SDR family NAD(P)-dependent oxidoreductase [Flavobacteriaceae bacterium]|nr:SDR family NAD(P)-dependent oxidoreductase [Flavobacteriaceae bacterium]MCY4267394.1 SDR family NAD(P)-dependent oxidoreductase [Flavobacteriaceae bacterium]
MNGRTVLITGANRGVGLEIGRQLGLLGFQVILTGRDHESGQLATDQLKAKSINAHWCSLDLCDPKSIQRAYFKVSQRIHRLDVLVNNGGVLVSESRSILNPAPEEDLLSVKTNALGSLWVTQYFMPLLKAGSRVIMISSGAGKFNNNTSTWAPHYRISKTLMNAITKQFHLSLKAKSIIINAVCPGWVRTQMGGQNATRSIEKGAETPVWLATEASPTINGKLLRDKQEIQW